MANRWARIRGYYPIDWPQLSDAIRFGRAGGQCERCGRPHGQTIVSLRDGRWYDAERGAWRDDRGADAEWPDVEAYAASKNMKVVLTCAHVDQDTWNNDPANLLALCRRCHIRHDDVANRWKARVTILLRRALGDLLTGPYRHFPLPPGLVEPPPGPEPAARTPAPGVPAPTAQALRRPGKRPQKESGTSLAAHPARSTGSPMPGGLPFSAPLSSTMPPTAPR